MTFKERNHNQPLLLPPSFKDFLGEGHEVVMLEEFMQELDTRALEQSYRNANGGSSAYHPAMLLAVLTYGYMNGVFSSRKIARRLRQDLAFM
jgi:transposase